MSEQDSPRAVDGCDADVDRPLNHALRNRKRYRNFVSHFWPRSRIGQLIVTLFVLLLALAEWPLLSFANRIEPQILGLPFLFGYLLLVYVAMICVLVVAAWLEL